MVVVTIGPWISRSSATGTVITQYTTGFHGEFCPIVVQNSESLPKPSTGSTEVGKTSFRNCAARRAASRCRAGTAARPDFDGLHQRGGDLVQQQCSSMSGSTPGPGAWHSTR
jgi:hypothetical protein